MADETERATQEAEADAPASFIDPQLEIRDADKRELGMLIVPWDTVIETNLGPEMFQRGAFSEVDPKKVVLRMDHDNPPTGRGVSLEEREDGAHMGFRVSKTSRGDDQLTLVSDGTSTGASVGFHEVPGGTLIEQRNGRRVRVHRKVNLREVSTTWQPAYERAAVTYLRSQDDAAAPAAEGDAPVAEEQAPASGATETVQSAPPVTFDFTPFERAVTSMNETATTIASRLDRLEEQTRSQFSIPDGKPHRPKATQGDWFLAALQMFTGERISQRELETRDLAELITTDNLGVVPDAFSSELIGVIDPRRPFMQSTRRLNTPASGMTLVMPKIITRPTVAQQMEEKDQLQSTETSVTTVTFDAVSKGGAGDISLQLLKRSDPSFLGLYLELLAEAYAQEAEQEAVEALLDSGVNSGGAMDPEALVLASAWSDTFQAIRRPPDTIWLSSAAVGAFLDAKADGTNAPLYSQITANFTAGGGVGGSISGLRAVHVPALDATANDVIIGPSSGFAWAEDGTYTLQVDVPAKAGRDVAIIGMLWFAPLYPAAFTAYSVAGGGS